MDHVENLTSKIPRSFKCPDEFFTSVEYGETFDVPGLCECKYAEYCTCDTPVPVAVGIYFRLPCIVCNVTHWIHNSYFTT